MFTDVIGNNWPRVYFISYWVIVNLVVLNIVISFVLEIYDTVGEDIAKAHVKLEYAKELIDMFEDDDQFIEYL
jgi:hypothetical protein